MLSQPFEKMFKTSYNSDTKLWTGPDRLEIYQPSDTIGKVILDALDGPLKVIQVTLRPFFFISKSKQINLNYCTPTDKCQQ